MNYQTIPLSVPDPINELFKYILTIEPNSSLAGGFLCDLFVGAIFNDVDLFIHYRNRIEVLHMLEIKFNLKFKFLGDEYTDFAQTLEGVYETSYKGFPIQLVFSKMGLDAVEHFDLCFRQWYYDGDHVYASEKALEDIRNKQMRIHQVSNGYNTLHRYLRFKEKYGFILNKESQKMLDIHLLAWEGITDSGINRYLRERVKNAEIRSSFQRYIGNLKDQYDEIKPHLQFLRNQVKNFVQSEEYVKNLLQLTSKPIFTCAFLLTENPFVKKIGMVEEQIKQLVKTNRTRLIYHANLSPYLDDWNQNIHNPTYIYTVFKRHIDQNVRSNKPFDPEEVSFLTHASSLFDQIATISEQALVFQPNLTIEIYKFIPEYRSEDFKELQEISRGLREFVVVKSQNGIVWNNYSKDMKENALSEAINTIIKEKRNLHA